ncbi:Outer membrane protein beta-barrel domain-containing protein [Mucilaginibacter sp. OK268]|uniref:porin family protein n=1 Tax=Mucilaginibacter sp. OK268 TaxID=1881048 RepID=UPI000881D076|nr:porin family protein [Mucilaginibacter sp. OK268]SDP70040.1 Outer membrane protein beta-barrel domain-containing protein [Mucilaginibacter sp. OK268]
MKKTIILTLSICLFTIGIVSAQIIPNFSFGVKGGLNYTAFPSSGIFNNSNRAGYLAGVWARVGGLGFNFQPELYVTGKNIRIKDDLNNENTAKFTSIDVPLLFGGKIGAFGLGGRFYGGPVLSFAVNKDQSLTGATSDATSLRYKDANYGFQIGAGVDISSFSVDLRYEGGLNKIAYGDGNSHTRVNVFSLALAYKLFSL